MMGQHRTPPSIEYRSHHALGLSGRRPTEAENGRRQWLPIKPPCAMSHCIASRPETTELATGKNTVLELRDAAEIIVERHCAPPNWRSNCAPWHAIGWQVRRKRGGRVTCA